MSHLVLIAAILVGSWLLVYDTNGTSEAYVYSFFIAVIWGARTWNKLGGGLIGLVAGIMLGPLMPLTVHPFHLQATSNWLVRTGVLVLMGLLMGYLFQYLKRQQERISDQVHDIEHISTDLILALAHTIELRDPYTNGHCHRVADMSRLIGERMGLSKMELRNLYWAGLIHDIGKIAIPESVLNKPGKLDAREYSMVKQHPVMGEWVLSHTQNAHLYRDGVVAHHERWDGNGYPHGLRETQIPLQGRILAVADTFDAISSDRPYRGRMPFEKCMEIMRSGRGTQFDPAILDVFLEIITSNVPISSTWSMSWGESLETKQQSASS